MSSHQGYYSSLAERVSGNVPILQGLYTINKQIAAILDSLFVSNGVRLSIPRWKKDDSDISPTYHYVIQFSSRNRQHPLFFEPYDPLIITEYKKNNILTVIDEQTVYARDDDTAQFIISELTILSNNPRRYFKEVGKRWSKCLICTRTLTNVESMKRAMGPVCYGRVRDIADVLRNIEEGGKVESYVEVPDINCDFGCDVLEGPDGPEVELILKMPDTKLLNPIELEGLNKINSKLQKYINVGAIYSPQGLLTVEPNVNRIRVNIKYLPGTVNIKLENGRDRWFLRQLVQRYPRSEYNEKDDSWTVSNRTYTTISGNLSVLNPEEPFLGSKTHNIRIEENEDGILVYNFPYDQRSEIKKLRSRWRPDLKAWVVPNDNREELNVLINKIESE